MSARAFSSDEFQQLLDTAEEHRSGIHASTQDLRDQLYRENLILRGQTHRLEDVQENLHDRAFLEKVTQETGLTPDLVPLAPDTRVPARDRTIQGRVYPMAATDPVSRRLTLPLAMETPAFVSENRILASVHVPFVSLEHRTEYLGGQDPVCLVASGELPYVLRTSAPEPIQSPYGTGALLEVTVDLEASGWANTMTIEPFVSPGLELIDLWIKTVDDNTIYLMQEPIVLNASLLFSFPVELVRSVGLRCIQRNATVQSEVEVLPKLSLPGQQTKETKSERHTRFIYDYGLNAIDLSYRTYGSHGVFLSEIIRYNHPLRAVSLAVSAEEGHGFIEYEVSPQEGIWFPIMPLGTDTIRERLMFELGQAGQYQTQLRFSPFETITVFRNGTRMPSDAYELDDRTIALLQDIDPSGYYYVIYRPVFGSDVVNFWDELGESPLEWIEEEFVFDRPTSMFRLSRTPFIDRALLYEQDMQTWDPSILISPYCPIQVRIEDADSRILTQPPRPDYSEEAIWNRTDYLDQGIGFTTDQHREYQVLGTMMQFNTPIQTQERVMVSYPTYISQLRVRAALTQSHDHLDETPSIHRLGVVTYPA